MFKRRGHGQRLFQPVSIGDTWLLEAERLPDGTIQAYATRFTGHTFDMDSDGHVEPKGLPTYVKAKLRNLVAAASRSFDYTGELLTVIGQRPETPKAGCSKGELLTFAERYKAWLPVLDAMAANVRRAGGTDDSRA